ncbi:helix-turn-helix domain-containing protein [Yersinia enterocolitica]|uniref:helix-turn-helix domain-containing protein n=1 Tax=Yersinia enterocolitica TaxID=630 RepID=UPI000976DE85|nr:helix-turn-helix transcriptional regulator [Yersinia enterocolitica]ELI7923967.1 LuxR family transcriptional regulator [Yersinia enterocolitica]
MPNIIIFSQYDLIRYFFNEITSEVFNKESDKFDVSITICYSLSEFHESISLVDNARIILDADNLSKLDLLYIFSLINNKTKKSSVFLFIKEKNALNFLGEMRNLLTVFLYKNAPLELLKRMLEDFVLERQVKKRDLKISSQLKGDCPLTQRENEVMHLILNGISNSDIAGLLNISHKTASAHRMKIYRKYNVNNLMGLYIQFKHDGVR